MNGWWLTWDARKRNVLFFDWSEPFSGENGPGDCRDTAHILIPRTGGERERKDLMERKKRRRRQEAQMSDSRLYDVSPPQSPWQSKTQSENLQHTRACQKKSCFPTDMRLAAKATGDTPQSTWVTALFIPRWLPFYSVLGQSVLWIVSTLSETHLHKLDEVLGQFVISQVFVKAAYSKVPDHGVWIVTVQQLHGLLWTDRWPLL